MNELLRTGIVHTLHKRIKLAFGVLLLVIIVGGSLNAFSNYYLDNVNSRHIAFTKDVDTMLNAMINQETGLRGYLYIADPTFLQPYTQGVNDYHMAQEPLQSLLQQDNFVEGQLQLSYVDASAQAWSTTYASAEIRLTQSHGSVVPNQTQAAVEGKHLFDRFRSEVENLRTLIDANIQSKKTLSYQLDWGSFGLTIFLSLLVIAISWWLLRSTTFNLARQFLAIRTTAVKLTQGDLQARAPLVGYEELVQVGKAINHMIDALQQKQATLIESERQFRPLAETIPHLVWVVSPQGVLQYCNQRWYDYSGLTLQQSQTWTELAHPEDRKRCKDEWREMLTTGSPLEVEIRFKRDEDRMYRWNLLQALPVMDQEGEISKWFVTVTDIEDRKQMKSLAEVNQRQRIFVSTVGHEFRTSLTSIQGFSQLLTEEDLSIEEIKEFGNDISEESLRLHRMIDDVLDLEKMREGKMPLHRTTIEINTLLREIVERTQATSQQHVIRCQLDERLVSPEADRNQLVRVVTNLLSNAIKYAPEGGEICVTSAQEGNMLHVSVRDHGIGISPEGLQQIFIPFHRGDAENMAAVRGTGLGLPIVEQIVTQHGGRIWVESVQGLGSVFHFTLPLTLVPASTESSRLPAFVEAKASTRLRPLQGNLY